MIPDHDYETSNHWLSAFTVDPQVITPTEIIDALAKENIESRPVWKPMHMQPVFEEYDFIGGNVAQSLYENAVSDNNNNNNNNFENYTKITRTFIQDTFLWEKIAVDSIKVLSENVES